MFGNAIILLVSGRMVVLATLMANLDWKKYFNLSPAILLLKEICIFN